MITESKPSKWAISAAAELFADRHGGVPLKVVGSAARVIDREAVAPAVRELVTCLETTLAGLHQIASDDPRIGALEMKLQQTLAHHRGQIPPLTNADAARGSDEARQLLDRPEEKP